MENVNTTNNALVEYQQWLQKAEIAGFKMITFKAPCCLGELKTVVPEEKNTMWDSISVCPHCHEPFIKKAYSTRVELFRVVHPSTDLKTA